MSTWWRRGLALIVSASMVLGSMPAQALGEAIEEVKPTEDVAQVEAADEEPELEVATSEEALPEDDVEEPSESAEGQDQEQDTAAVVESDIGEGPSDMAHETVDSDVVLTTQGLTAAEYWNKVNSFMNDSKWRNGVSWGSGHGAYCGYNGSGCNAYAADFVNYVYGAWGPGSGTPFYSPSEIRTGDIIHTGGHWFVVIERNGSAMLTAEGNVSGVGNLAGDGINGERVWITTAHYYISGNTLVNAANGSTSFSTGYHYDTGGATTSGASADRQPLGKVDASAAGPSTIRVAGWAYDPDVPSQSIDVDVYVDGQMAARVQANTVRSDVNNAFGITGNHGFDATFVTTVRGTHKVVVYALNNKHDGGNPALDNDYTSEFTVNVTDPSIRNGAICDLPQHEWFMLVPAGSQTRAMRIEDAANGSVAEISGGDGVVGLSSYYWFSFVKHSSGSYGIQWERDDSYYLHVSTDWTANAGIVGWQTYGNANSLWVPEKNSDGTYSFRNAAYNTYIDLRGGQDTFKNTFCHYPGNGSNAQKFRLVPVHKSLSDSNVTVTCPQNVAYTGSAVKPNIKVEFMGITLKEGEDYTVSYQNNINPGTATATITGVDGTPVNTDFRGFRGWYYGSRKVNFTISKPKVDISDATVSAIAAKTYTGSAIKPAVTVTLDGSTLVAGTDYTVSYANNVNAGTATVTVTGKGNYAGSVSRKFTIARASVAVPKAANYTYDGKGHTGVAKGTGYALSGTTTATNAGTYEATATLDANHKWADGTTAAKKVSWRIAKAKNPIAAKAVARTASAKTLKSKAVAIKKSSVSVSKAQGKVKYAKASGAKCLSINKSTGRVTVKKGTKKGTYKIKVKVTAAGNANYKAGSKTVTCKVTVK